jgi:non-heme chloroperoxidase
MLPSDPTTTTRAPGAVENLVALGRRDEGDALAVRTPDDLSLSARIYGDANHPEIVFIHGLGQSRLSWKQQVDSLWARFRVVTYDLRGHGDSEKPASAEAYIYGARWADDLRAVIDAAGLRRPVLVGWSLGGLVIGHFLARHDDRPIAGINLVSAVTKLSPELLASTAPALVARLGSPKFGDPDGCSGGVFVCLFCGAAAGCGSQTHAGLQWYGPKGGSPGSHADFDRGAR